MSEDADRVVFSYRATEGRDEWVRDALTEDAYVAYLRRVHGGRVTVGDEYEEFVSRGCGTPVDLVLRVEAVDGGSRLGPETDLAFEAAGR